MLAKATAALAVAAARLAVDQAAVKRAGGEVVGKDIVAGCRRQRGLACQEVGLGHATARRSCLFVARAAQTIGAGCNVAIDGFQQERCALIQGGAQGWGMIAARRQQLGVGPAQPRCSGVGRRRRALRASTGGEQGGQTDAGEFAHVASSIVTQLRGKAESGDVVQVVGGVPRFGNIPMVDSEPGPVEIVPMRTISIAMLVATLACAACKKEPEKPATPPPPPPAAPKPPEEPKGLPAPADVAAAPADAEKTASGLASKVVQKGTGSEHPGAEDTVKVHYTGWMTNGKMFDSSVVRGSPAEFPLDHVIKGWTEGVQLMVVGEKRRFWIPGNLAYGDTPRRPGAPAGTLVFDVELLGITKAPPAPAVPTDVAAAPKTAKKTASGLSYRVLVKGKGKTHPTAESTVKVHYTGWTTDGKRFDSSVVRGQPTEFPLNGVIKGWTEGVQLMVEGEKTRFWIPGELAYGVTPGAPGRPYGTLVFDIELLEIKK
jgi:peptidylprolyl isomerase